MLAGATARISVNSSSWKISINGYECATCLNLLYGMVCAAFIERVPLPGERVVSGIAQGHV